MQSERKEEEIETKTDVVVRDAGLYQKHREIVQEWNVLTGKLAKLAERWNDDEKEPLNHQQEHADKLLAEYVHSHELIQSQEVRLERVDGDNHLNELTSHHHGLRVLFFSIFSVFI